MSSSAPARYRDSPAARRTSGSARARLDPRQPLVVDIRQLGRRPGSMRRLDLQVPAPDGLATAVIGVPTGGQLALDLRLEAVMEGVLVSGTLRAPVEAECARCLDPVRDTLRVPLQELYAYPESATEQTTEDDEVSRVVGDLLDLEPVVRDAVVLGLPLMPVCEQACPGLCATCGEKIADLPAEHAHDEVDPRWAALEQLRDAEQLKDPEHLSKES